MGSPLFRAGISPTALYDAHRGDNNTPSRLPSSSAVRELIFCAHYDSKTDFWDHIQRAKLYQFSFIRLMRTLDFKKKEMRRC